MQDYTIPKINQLKVNDAISEAAFGLATFAGLQNLKVIEAQNNPYIIQEGAAQDVPEPKFISKLGTVVYSNMIINAGTDPNTGFAWEDFRIDDALFMVTQSKRIVQTEIMGKDNPVVEYIGLDAFQIQVTGRITGAYNVYEKELVATLKKILDLGQPLAISSWYLQNLDITDVIVKDFDFGQAEGEYSTQYFTINMQSDKIVEALITGQ